MVSMLQNVAIDCADAYELARFWSNVTGRPLQPGSKPGAQVTQVQMVASGTGVGECGTSASLLPGTHTRHGRNAAPRGWTNNSPNGEPPSGYAQAPRCPNSRPSVSSPNPAPKHSRTPPPSAHAPARRDAPVQEEGRGSADTELHKARVLPQTPQKTEKPESFALGSMKLLAALDKHLDSSCFSERVSGLARLTCEPMQISSVSEEEEQERGRLLVGTPLYVECSR